MTSSIDWNAARVAADTYNRKSNIAELTKQRIAIKSDIKHCKLSEQSLDALERRIVDLNNRIDQVKRGH